ncbi:hypothetical protein GLOTRDRAFT_105750 [Gloeophyllum trabeum ATCC 11539]|uniref:Wax synthase domain-containing protein n=1 Tax=Gloeophyllum trabeum (strain ATCC 11539 / FP-39264 / Madison 617) TaxID=670483 RepID=S7Q8S6_GLOTA|nr:uncharacterized protein GLOTRDRAFT_105750 [Gloeophyllum trabeum ATCC 11539]EPQ55828.1 hypothetical protein GLOTRDRAFT_105750 [Gloeophyllum trabeum ATCC 11539]
MSQSNRRPFSAFWDLFLPDVCLSLIISLRPKTSIKLACFIAYCVVLFSGFKLTTGDPLHNYSMGSAITSHIATAIHFVWLTDPVRDFRHEKDTVDPASLPILQRWWWMLCAVHCPRGVGWNYQVANVPTPPTKPRWQFVLRQLRRTAWFFLLVDLAQTYVKSNPYYTDPTPYTSPFTSQGYTGRVVNIVAWMTLPYGTMNMNYAALSAVCVALGLSEPRYWPDLFGAWSDSYTVRRFWGRTWHQLMRRYISSIGKFFVYLFGFKKGTNGSSYTQLYVGFTVSGLVHMGGDTMVGKEYLGASFHFFIAQAMAITAEDAVIATARRAALDRFFPQSVARLIGYAWTFLWFSLSTAWYIQWAVDAGMAKSAQPLKFSAIQTALRALS